MNIASMTPEVLELVASRFKALAEPVRLQILAALKDGEQTVSELMTATDVPQANASRHLKVLHDLGFVRRRRDGPFVYYALANKRVFQLCEIMCGQLEHESQQRKKLFAG
jgi:ArsR family transcriptional regulator